MTVRIILGHVLDALRDMPSESVHCVVTSPPYYGLRDYGIEPQVWPVSSRIVQSGRIGAPGCEHDFQIEMIATEVGKGNWAQGTNGRGELQLGGWQAKQEPIRATAQRGFCRHCAAWRGSLGLEPTPTLYIEHMVAVFREVRRVLRKDGTLWLNIGDSYSSGGRPIYGPTTGKQATHTAISGITKRSDMPSGIKPKDLLGMPWMLAFALRDDGWYLRSEITWAKRSPMPESVTDRPTTATEKVFLLSKSARYFYDAEAVKEEAEYAGDDRGARTGSRRDVPMANAVSGVTPAKRNMRNWWLLVPEPFPEAHFATFPTEIPRRAILAGTKPGDVVLDPFLGAGTTALVADQLQRNAIGIELKPEYAEMGRRRVERDAGMFAQFAAD